MIYAEHVVRRGLQHPAAAGLMKRASDARDIIPHGAALFLVVVTAIIFLISLISVDYTLKDVIATLAMVETPSAAITVSPSEERSYNDQKEPLLEDGPAITIVHRKPITASIRGTIKHLTATAGRCARMRGFRASAFYHICLSIVVNIFESITPRFPGRLAIITALSTALLVNLHATWTHVVISMPSRKHFWARIVPRSQWKNLALPAIVEAFATYASAYVVLGFGVCLGLHKYKTAEDVGVTAYIKVAAVIVFGILFYVFLVLPAHVTRVRVEASMLPDDDDAIVPFDRSFDGKVTPRVLGGTGAVGFVDAWRSFNWEARRRVIKLYIKTFAITTLLTIACGSVLLVEAGIIIATAPSPSTAT